MGGDAESRYFSVHVLLYVDYFGEPSPEDGIHVWENIYLVRANDCDEAAMIGERLGRLNEGDADGSNYRLEKKARWIFAGVREVISITNMYSQRNCAPGSGDELTYLRYNFDSMDDIFAILDGKVARVAMLPWSDDD